MIVSRLKGEFGHTPSFILRHFRRGSTGRREAVIAYIDGLADKETINQHILKSTLLESALDGAGISKERGGGRGRLEAVLEHWITVGEAKVVESWEEAIDGIVAGATAIFIDGAAGCILAATPGWERRGVAEPTSESVVRGPREGFTETIRTNESLLFRRIKNPRLRFERFTLGRVTKTTVTVAYVHGIADDELVQEVFRRIERIDIDGVVESGYIEEYIEDSPWSPFPQTLRTERPDVVAANLLEGRVAVLTDGTPFVLVLPVVFTQLLTSPEDYYERFLPGTFIRILRYGSFFMALILPSVYIAVTTFHQELLPTRLILTIAGARQGVPFPALVEAFLLEILFEVLREAGVRLPRIVGSAVSIVGALVVGEAAVSAGLVSSAMVIIVAMTAISSFATPVFSFALGARMLRFAFMLAAATMGLFGVQTAALLLLLHLVSLRSFGIPYLAPVAPLHFSDFKDVLVRAPHWAMVRRPASLPVGDPIRHPPRELRMRPPADESIPDDQGPVRGRGPRKGKR